MNTKVTIGLCVKNAAKNVQTALNSISIQDYPHQFLKIVIVVDGSSDNTLSLASEFAQKTDIPTIVTFNDDKGLGAARQVVVDNAEGDYIVWVDDDFVLMRDFIRNQVDFMEKNPNVGAASSTVIPTCETVISMLDTVIFSLPQRWRCSTGGAIFRLEAILGVQGFDTKIKGAGEDWDISHRIAESGWALVNNDPAIFYRKYPPSTPLASWRKYYWYGYGNHLLYHKFKDQNLLLPYFPLRALSALKVSGQVYAITHKKRVFLFPLYAFFLSIAWNFGFIRAHAAGYGHSF